MMAAEPANELSVDEATQYDRQIRLWGVDAQKRMRAARILVAGARALSAEVCKNIVLAGMGKLVLCDHESVTPADMYGQFLVGESDIGKNRAESSLARLQVLNPHVQITADTDNISGKPDSFFLDFDIVLLTGAPLQTIAKVDDLCRQHSKQFFCGDVLGYYGFCFLDLGEHHYISEKTLPPKEKDGEAETVVEECHLSYSSWRQAVSKDWRAVANLKKELRVTSWLFFALQILDKYRETHGHVPTGADPAETAQLVAMKNEFMLSKGLDAAEIVTDEAIMSLARGAVASLSPVCAVVGGILGQEILKVASGKDRPHNNFFFYDGLANCGTVEHHS